jgi:hypothetical protein
MGRIRPMALAFRVWWPSAAAGRRGLTTRGAAQQPARPGRLCHPARRVRSRSDHRARSARGGAGSPGRWRDGGVAERYRRDGGPQRREVRRWLTMLCVTLQFFEREEEVRPSPNGRGGWGGESTTVALTSERGRRWWRGRILSKGWRSDGGGGQKSNGEGGFCLWGASE